MLDSILNLDGAAGRRAFLSELQLVSGKSSAAVRQLPVGSQGAVKICDPGDTRRRIHKARIGQIQLMNFHLRLERCHGGIARIDRPRLTVEFQIPASRQISRQSKRELRREREIGDFDVYFVVHLRLLGGVNLRYRDAAVRDFQLLDRKIGRNCAPRRFRGPGCTFRFPTETREIPLAGGRMQEGDFRSIQGECRHVQCLGKDQRHDFDTHFQRLCANKRRLAETGVVSDG